MTKSIVTIMNQQIEITNHDDQEFYATWDGQEIGYSESLDELISQVESHLDHGLQLADEIYAL